MSQMEYNDSLSENERSRLPMQSQEVPEESKIVPKKKGRPKGALNGTRKTISKLSTSHKDRLPKMKTNVATVTLSAENKEELKKRPYAQPGVCLKIAPELDLCKTCFRFNNKRVSRHNRQINCRFYQFRILRFNEATEKLEVAGFPDPLTDPVEVDRNIWLPNMEKRFKTLSVMNARLILTHVGEELCQIMQKEKMYYEKFKSDDKPVIWKRLIAGVIELCDLCSTTLFNFHFICTRCGLSLCVDCVIESKNATFDITCSSKEQLEHTRQDLSLTQIIVGGCLEKLQSLFHEVCHLWEIDHHCELMAGIVANQLEINVAKNILIEIETGKTIFDRELGRQASVLEVDISKLNVEPEPEPLEDFDANFDEYFNKFRKPSNRKEHCITTKYSTIHHNENVVSISRRMNQLTSNMFHPGVPHKWLCEGKLLRLLDPLHPGNESLFDEQWERGQPVLISNMLDHLTRELWIPQSFSAEFGTERSDFVNCMTGKIVRNREISTFWDGFENVEKRLLDSEGKSMLLKLKDWPPDSDFKNIMPSRFEDIMKNLPLNEYTNRTGDLNIVKYLPNCFLHPDLGPKGYFAYGSPFFLKEGTTNLHLDVSDAVNVMCYIGFPQDKQISAEQYIEQGFKAILEADCDLANINRVIEEGEVPGAIWHIYEASDADRIRDFLLKIAVERGSQVADDHDVIHDQNWYLDGDLRARLFKEYGVKGYSIVQCLGDCITLPAGTPHQVRNIYSCIKIAEDFVSPQQVSHCLSLSNQFRKLTKTHTNNEEKLNIKNVAYHSVKEAIATLSRQTKKRTNFFKNPLKETECRSDVKE